MGKRIYNLYGKSLSAEQQQLVMDHLDYALSGAKRHFGKSGGKADYDELVSAAYFGLVQAAIRFDPSRPASFKTYAFPWIESQLRRNWQDIQRAWGWSWRNINGRRPERDATRISWPSDRKGRPVDFRDEPTRRI